MKLRKAIILTLLIGLCFVFSCSLRDVQDTEKTQKEMDVQETVVEDPVLTVLNPLGTPPPIILKAMAPRLDTIKGKTIYVDNNGYPGTSILLPELIAVMKEKFPTTKFIYNDKPAGSMMPAQDSAVGEADALIVATGH